MAKVQKVKFDSIQDFFNYLPEHELDIVQHLRSIVLACFPDPKEKLSYNVLYYYQHSRVCFIWPSSIPWGKVKNNGVLLGFCNGIFMRDEIDYLEKGDRKQVYVKTYYKTEDIDPHLVKTYIFEAILVDERLKKNKK